MDPVDMPRLQYDEAAMLQAPDFDIFVKQKRAVRCLSLGILWHILVLQSHYVWHQTSDSHAKMCEILLYPSIQQFLGTLWTPSTAFIGARKSQ